MGLKLVDVDVENFRSFHDVKFTTGRKITAISGQNGVGKSNLVSLIASGSGLNRKANFGSNFQPEFYSFFNIDPTEDYPHYSLFLKYEEPGKQGSVVKKLTFKDETATKRGIRIIPRTSAYGSDISYKEAQQKAKDTFDVGGAARIPIPTIYLSISRLYPLGERVDTVTVTQIKKTNKLYQSEADKKFHDWYNYVIPGSIKNGATLSMVEKEASSRASLHMDMERTPTLSQSVGQDNIGNIVSALVDIYILSKQPDYNGAIICVDEIEVSLHPDTQLRLLSLFNKLSGELDIQFIVSTHSLTILKEMLKMQSKNQGDYTVVYLKNPSAPMVTQHHSYELLKADLLGQTTFDRPKPKAYFEDEVGQHIFELLVKSLDQQCETICDGNELRGQSTPVEAIPLKRRIENLSSLRNANSNINEIVMKLGCEELIKIAERDSNYFNRVIFLVDGDARYKDSSQKPKVRDYLTVPFNRNGINERKHNPNICFLPNFFAPESYLYRIINELVCHENDHTVFWRTLDQKEETALYTATKVREMFSGLPDNFNNDDLKCIFGEYHPEKNEQVHNSEVWNFVDKSDLLNYYYGSYDTVVELLCFFEKFKAAYEMTRSKTLENRFG